MFNYAQLVDCETLQGVIYNQDSKITEALRQIHVKTLGCINMQGSNNSTYEARVKEGQKQEIRGAFRRSFVEVLRDSFADFTHNQNKKQRFEKRQARAEGGRVELFFNRLHEQVSQTEFWKALKQICPIKDTISFPCKRDNFGNKFGFVKTMSKEGAMALLTKRKAISFNGKTVSFAWCKQRRNKMESEGKKQEGIER
ncbi:hypothetical protein AgCh_008196 [Apium graveolens]